MATTGGCARWFEPVCYPPAIRYRMVTPMRRLSAIPLHFVLVAGLCLLLAACGSSIRERVYPPSASLQQLTAAPDGSWQLELVLRNYGNVTIRVDRIDVSLVIDGIDAGLLQQPGQTVGPTSREVLLLEFQPSPAAAERVAAALASRQGLRYRLAGTLETSEPERRRDSFEFESVLTPMPGLEGVLR
jgi:hypothetical protein